MNKLKVFLLMLIAPLCLAQTGSHRIGQVLVKGNNIAANVAPYASVMVCVANTGCATAANVYSDQALTVPLTLPLVADGSGNYDYYVGSGCVDEQITSPGSEAIFLPNVCPFNGTGGANLTAGAVQFATSTSLTRAATFSDIASLFTGTSPCYLRSDGECSASSGGASPISAGAVQTANVNATAFFNGGQYNTEVFNTSNNGVAAAQALGLTDLFIPSYSTSNETIFTAPTLPSTRIEDDRYGSRVAYLFNTGLNGVSSNSFPRDAIWNYCFLNDLPVVPNQTSDCNQIIDNTTSPGFYEGGQPTAHTTFDVSSFATGLGISSIFTTIQNCFHLGDCNWMREQQTVRGGEKYGSDEGAVGLSVEQMDQEGPHGTVTSSTPITSGRGTGQVTVVTSPTSLNIGETGALVDTSEIVSSGTMTASTTRTSPLTNQITTSTTHTASTGIGTISADCGPAYAQTATDNPVSSSCTFTVTSGTIAAGVLAIGDNRHPECVKVTAAGGGTFTAGLTVSHPAGTQIGQGTSSCSLLALGQGYSDPTNALNPGFFTTYFIVGAESTTSYDYIDVYKEDQQGNPPIVLSNITAAITSLSRTGSTVTATINGVTAYQMNNLTLAPLASIVVAGNTAVNGTVTGPVAISRNNTTQTATFTLGSGTATGTGGTIRVAGLDNFVIYQGAEITRVLGTNGFAASGAGTLQVAPSNAAFTAGDNISMPNFYFNTFTTARFSYGGVMTGNDPSINIDIASRGQSASGGVQIDVGGDGGFDPYTDYTPYGGPKAPMVLVHSNDFYGNIFELNAPMGTTHAGAIFNIQGVPTGSPWSVYDLFNLNNLDLQFNQTLGNISWAGSWTNSGSTATSDLHITPTGFGGTAGVHIDEFQNNLFISSDDGNGNPTYIADQNIAGASLSAPQVVSGVLAPPVAPTANGALANSTGAIGSGTICYQEVSVSSFGMSLPNSPTNGNCVTNTLAGSVNVGITIPFGQLGAQTQGFSFIRYSNTLGLPNGFLTGCVNVASVNPHSVCFDTGQGVTGTAIPTTDTSGKLISNGLQVFPVVTGSVALVAGTATVTTTAAQAISGTHGYHLTNCIPSGTAVGTLSVGTVTAGTSFVINSKTATNTLATGDTSTVCWGAY